MCTSQNLKRSARLLAAVTLCCLGALSGFASDEVGVVVSNSSSNEALRSYLQLQEQLHATQLALERNRLESEALAARNAETVAARFKTIEEALTSKRVTELETMKDSMAALERSMAGNNRMLLLVAGTIASVGFLVLLLTAYLQWRSVNRLAEFAATTQSARFALPAPSSGEMQFLGAGQVSQASGRLSYAMSQLEKRILELEHTAHLPAEAKVLANAEPGPGGQSNGDVTENGHHEPTDQLTELMTKGQSLLNLDKAAEALECFEEILRMEPNHGETLVKKGIALEELRRMDEALQCYDSAIAANGDLTIAYLQKGGLFNRLERYEEALKCYEQALLAQEKAHTT